MEPTDFLASAVDQVESGRRGRPRETNLRRAVSTTYYAMFHRIAQSGADLIVGGSGADRSDPAWRQAYRALDHGVARQRCEYQKVVSRFPAGIQRFASFFVVMQAHRHAADYDPSVGYFKSQVLALISDADQVIDEFQSSPAKDRRAFAVYVLLKLRS